MNTTTYTFTNKFASHNKYAWKAKLLEYGGKALGKVKNFFTGAPKVLKQGQNALSHNPYAHTVTKELPKGSREYRLWNINNKRMNRSTAGFFEKQTAALKQDWLTNKGGTMFDLGFMGWNTIPALMEGDYAGAALGAGFGAGYMGMNRRFRRNNIKSFTSKKGLAGNAAIIGGEMLAQSTLQDYRDQSYKAKSKKDFLKHYYKNMTRSQMNDVSPEKTMKYDSQSKQWYIPNDANYQYYNNPGLR